jgi:hypothetical protein
LVRQVPSLEEVTKEFERRYQGEKKQVKEPRTLKLSALLKLSAF